MEVKVHFTLVASPSQVTSVNRGFTNITYWLSSPANSSPTPKLNSLHLYKSTNNNKTVNTHVTAHLHILHRICLHRRQVRIPGTRKVHPPATPETGGGEGRESRVEVPSHASCWRREEGQQGSVQTTNRIDCNNVHAT